MLNKCFPPNHMKLSLKVCNKTIYLKYYVNQCDFFNFSSCINFKNFNYLDYKQLQESDSL